MRVFVALLALAIAAGCSTEPPIIEPVEPEPLLTGFPLEPSDSRPNRSERELFERLADATDKLPVTAAAVAGAFDLRSECATQGCHFDQTAIGGLVSRKGDLRFDRNGLIFELDNISGQCVRASVVARRFKGGGVEQSCFDAQCWYYRARQSWGALSFGLPEPGGACVKSVIVDTYRQ